MKSMDFIYKSKIMLDKERHNTALHKIELVNFARIRIMLVILFVVQIMFIIFNDINYLINPTEQIIWKDFSYFIVHLLLLSTSVIGFIIVNKLIKLDKGKWNYVYNFITPTLLIIYLILISFLNALDLLYIKDISSLFIANLLICGGFFIINIPKNLYIYGIPFLNYIGTFIYLDFDSDVILSSLINGLIFFIAIIIISTSIYNYQYEIIAKNIILDQTNNQLLYISSHDPLTGLLNRRCFMEQIEKKREGKMESAMIVLVDIDYFKNVNDKYGHPVGDLVLTKISSIIMNYMKESDMAVRWGGEEFLLFLNNTSMDEAYHISETIRKAIEDVTICVKEYKIQITASFGIAPLKNESDISFYSAYKAADLALYKAKNQGRNRVVKGG